VPNSERGTLLSLVVGLEQELFSDSTKVITDSQEAELGLQQEETLGTPEVGYPEENGPVETETNNSTPGISDSYRRREALTVLKLSVGPHFHALTDRDRFDLWTELQNDLSELHGPGRIVLDQIYKSLIDELTDVEKKAFNAEIDTDLVREALKNYWDYTYDPIPPTLRSTLESQFSRPDRFGSIKRDMKPRSPENSKRARKFSMRRSLFLGLVITVVAISAQMLYEFGQPSPPSKDIILLSVSSAISLDPDFRTSSEEQAERYISDRLGVRLQIPVITETRLLGVTIQLFHGDLEVPVLIYRDDKEELEFPVYAYSYAFLQSNRLRVELDGNLLHRIEDPTQFGVEFYNDRSALVWRNRDDIFAAVLKIDPGEMQDRIEIL